MPPSPEIEFTSLREMEHWSVAVAIEHRIVKLVRTSAPLTTVSEVAESFEEIGGIVAKFPTRSWGLVLDMRQARPAADREIEHALRTHRKAITAMFARHATLLATAAGVMQANRMLREFPDPKIQIFLDENEAYAWAEGGSASS